MADATPPPCPDCQAPTERDERYGWRCRECGQRWHLRDGELAPLKEYETDG